MIHIGPVSPVGADVVDGKVAAARRGRASVAAVEDGDLISSLPSETRHGFTSAVPTAASVVAEPADGVHVRPVV